LEQGGGGSRRGQGGGKGGFALGGDKFLVICRVCRRLSMVGGRRRDSTLRIRSQDNGTVWADVDPVRFGGRGHSGREKKG
jgi:hypothetical protein